MIRPLLLQIRRRLTWQAFCQRVVQLGVAAGTVLLGVVLWAPHAVWLAAGGLLLLVLAVAAFWAWVQRPSIEALAVKMDRLAGTKDRLTTALAFQETPRSQTDRAGWETAALAECEAFLQKVDFTQYTPWRVPREAKWLPLPFAAIAALSLWGALPHFGSQPQAVARVADAKVVKKAEELEKMAEHMEKSGAEADKKIAEALKKTAEQLRAEATAEAPQKAMLRELSALEQLLQEAQKGNDMQGLAKALEKAEALRRAAEALKKGEAATAADELEQAAQKMRELAEKMQKEGQDSPQGSELAQNGQKGQNGESGENSENGQSQPRSDTAQQMAQFEQAMRDAAKKMGEKSALGEAATQAADSAKRGEGKGMEQAMQRMAEAVRRSSKSNDGKGQAQLDASIAKLREMKSAQQGQEGSGEQKGASMAQAESGQKGGEGQQGQGMGDEAGGKPGSEHDEGTKASPYGKESGELAEQSVASQLQGLLGEGESLHSLTPTQGGDEKAQRGYKALYEAAAPEAENALDRENIPIGSRLYVKRYFEAIRPKK